MSQARNFSLGRAAYQILTRGVLSGVEAERNAEAQHLNTTKTHSHIGIPDVIASSSAFAEPVTTRVIDTVSGQPFLGTRPVQLSGPLAWAAVVKSGPTLLGPLKDEVLIFSDPALPTGSWRAENAVVVPADITFRSTKLNPFRVTGQVIVSKQLVLQFGGSQSLDQFIADRLKRSFASQIDKACLYGAGSASNQPTGIINTTGCHSVTTAVGPSWTDLAGMRYAPTNYDADLSTFGWISNQKGRKRFETTPRFTNAAGSCRDFMAREAEVSLEVGDDRVFSGVWAYMVIGYWLDDGEDGIGTDLTIDPFSRAQQGELLITGSVYVDTTPRWPELFSYSQASAFP
jgi:Phage capsid family